MNRKSTWKHFILVAHSDRARLFWPGFPRDATQPDSTEPGARLHGRFNCSVGSKHDYSQVLWFSFYPSRIWQQRGRSPTLYRRCLLFLSLQLFSFHPCPVLCSFKFSFHPRQASEVMSLFNCSYFKRSSPATNENKPGSRRAVRLSFWLQNSRNSGALLWDEFWWENNW